MKPLSLHQLDAAIAMLETDLVNFRNDPMAVAELRAEMAEMKDKRRAVVRGLCVRKVAAC